MKTLQQLKERKDELENELSAYKWWGNEDDADYEEEYGREYEHLQTELDGVNEEIYQLKNKKVVNQTSITFNENTYRFSYYEGRDGDNEIYECYGIYKNGELNSDWFLEEGTIESEKIYILYWKGFGSGIHIKDFSILEVAKVINHIININK